MKQIRYILIFIFLLNVFHIHAQKYVDLLGVSYGSTSSNNFENSNTQSNISYVDLSLTYPVKLNDNTAIISGVDYSKHTLDLFPDANATSLSTTTVKLGFTTRHDEHWSGTYVLLPKIASDYQNISGKDFQFGGMVLMKYKKNKNLSYKAGIYGSTEFFGMFTTLLAGVYYISPDEKFEMNLTLPMISDINYQLQEWINIGADFKAYVRSYNLSVGSSKGFYVDRLSEEMAGYLRFNMLKNSVLLQTKVGYAINEFFVYENGDKVDFGFSAFRFGDHRKQLNPELENGMFFRIGLIYRYHLH